ncbi:hypothetical protein AZG96_RS15595 [Acinetobacter baumannii]|nr:hypothetical protein [Acinetobacter baumannii]
MNATQFIKDHGLEKAREVVEGAPEGSSYLQAIGSGKLIHYLGVKDEDVQLFFIDHWRPTCFDPSDLDDDVFISLEHLKRLVESLDLIKVYGGIEQCRKDLKWVESSKLPETDLVKELKQAIRDHESIYGGGDD